MSQPVLTQLSVIDIVPFGNPGSKTGFYALRLSCPEWTEWQSGQFVMLRPTDCGPGMLWGRAFSICRLTPRDLVIFFQVRGRATSLMSKLQPGEMINVWGPLGNSFAVEPEKPTLLLAGGIGIAPFVGYMHGHPNPDNLTLEFGHRMPLECYPFDSLPEDAAVRAHLETCDEDRVAFSDLLDKRLAEFGKKDGLAIACGPMPFLKTVQRLALKHKTRTQLCLETRMACGVGACLGCVTKLHLPAEKEKAVEFKEGAHAPHEHGEGHYVQTCTCGPNFWADSVTLL